MESVQEAVDAEADAKRLARRIGKSQVLVVLGRGYDYSAALEGALKIKELARIWAEPYSTALRARSERALLERGTPVDPGARGALQERPRAVREVRTRTAPPDARRLLDAEHCLSAAA